MPLKPGNQWLPSPEPIVFLGLGVNTALTHFMGNGLPPAPLVSPL